MRTTIIASHGKSKTTTNPVLETAVVGADSFVNPQVIPYVGVLKGQPSRAAVALVFSIYGSGDSTSPL